jgi:hypothetical protein
VGHTKTGQQQNSLVRKALSKKSNKIDRFPFPACLAKANEIT